jgi:outer membrane protein TolC
MRIPPLLCLLSAILTAPVHAAEPLTLEEALATALRDHPQAAEAGENLNAAEAKVDQALAAYYPQVDFAADAAKARAYFPNLADTKRADVYGAAVSVRQSVFNFGRSAGATQAARGTRAAASESLALSRQDIAFRVKAAYYLALGTERAVATTGATLKARDELYRQAEAFFEQGVRSKVEVAKAEANLFAARTALLQAENARDLARAELADAMGLPSLGEREIGEAPAPAASPQALAPLQEQAYAHRRELKRLEALRAAGEGNLKNVRGERFPALSGTASYGLASGDVPPDRDVWSLGIHLTVPIFSGYSTMAKEREAAASLRALVAQHRNARLAFGREVEAAWLATREASARITSTAKEAEAAQETQSLALERYREGVGSVLEVTDAQAQALAAETGNIRATYDYLLALARLERAVGRDP